MGLALRPCTCPEVGDRLSEYLDEELGAVDRARLALHLAACPRCAEAARSLAETIRAIHRMAGWAGCRPACRRH
jgi:anti-sigma factor RsiW